MMPKASAHDVPPLDASYINTISMLSMSVGPFSMQANDIIKWHAIPTAEAAQRLSANESHGLTAAEVNQRLKTYGPNEMSAKGGVAAWLRFARQFNQAVVYILLAAAVGCFLLGEVVDAFVIVSVVMVNAIVGFIQEAKAEHALSALSQMMTTEANVRRDGQKGRVPSAELVPGDVVLLQSGDRVPADMRLTQVKNLQCDEAAMTGESVPAQKTAEPLPAETVLNDRTNIAFAGTMVTYGQAEGLVVATGASTETGKIATLVSQGVDLSTPLTRKLTEFTHLLVVVILVVALLMFGIAFWRATGAVDEVAKRVEAEHAAELEESGVPHPGKESVEHPFVYAFKGAVGMAVAAIPEGLPAAVTVTLALGVGRMARRRALIRRLPAVETLGSTTVICSDKTGTLTENQMTVQQILAGDEVFTLTGQGYDPKGEIQLGGKKVDLKSKPALTQILRAGLLCNDTHFVDENGRRKVQGDPTEAALIVSAEKAGLRREELETELPRRDVIPFESEYMFMATVHGPECVVYKKGSLERILDRCDKALDADGNETTLNKQAVKSAVEQLAAEGLRVLTFAMKKLDHDKLKMEDVEGGLVFLGLQGMIDPPRTEAIEAVKNCQTAGIRVKMITGDHAGTASAIAGQLGMQGIHSEHRRLKTLTGAELEKMSDEELPSAADDVSVFARVTPEQKLRLVKALQAHGHVVAMTGDGVNDAPAVKQANIGVAMGITGTDVAKGAAAMVLTDDNFASIEAAVEEGRNIFDNLLKFIAWTLPTNAGQSFILLVTVLLGTQLPITPAQLLWVNLTTAILLGLMLVFEPKESGLMNRPPRPLNEPLLSGSLVFRTALVSVIMMVGSLLLFNYELRYQGASLSEAQTVVVNVAIFVQAAYLLNCRSLTRSFFRVPLFSNPMIWLGIGATVVAQLIFVYVPIFHTLFHTDSMHPKFWLHVAAVGVTAFLIVEVVKFFERRLQGDSSFPAPPPLVTPAGTLR
ncbi:MAG TPA: HAD-IC family P-type ATPase [Nitrospira sp.]